MRLERSNYELYHRHGKGGREASRSWALVEMQRLDDCCVSPQVKPLGPGGVGRVGITFIKTENISELSTYNNLCSTLSGMISDKILSRGQWSLMHASGLCYDVELTQSCDSRLHHEDGGAGHHPVVVVLRAGGPLLGGQGSS